MYLNNLHVPVHTLVMYNIAIQIIQTLHWQITFLSKRGTLNMKISFLVMQNTHQKLNTKIKLDRKILSDVQLKTFKLFIKKTCILFSL